MKSNNLIAYSMDFTSFVLQKTKYKDKIKSIILFGSVAREEEIEGSDIDLFIDVTDKSSTIEDEMVMIREKFLESSKFKNYWKLLGIKNEIKLNVGDIREWKELQPSVLSNGITLYGKYKQELKEGRHKAYFIWENIKPNAKRVLFNKQVFGYRQNKKSYKGLLEKLEGERLGKGSIAVPLEHALVFVKLLRKFGITFKIKKILEY